MRGEAGAAKKGTRYFCGKERTERKSNRCGRDSFESVAVEDDESD